MHMLLLKMCAEFRKHHLFAGVVQCPPSKRPDGATVYLRLYHLDPGGPYFFAVFALSKCLQFTKNVTIDNISPPINYVEM
jgi:hypothetical protein